MLAGHSAATHFALWSPPVPVPGESRPGPEQGSVIGAGRSARRRLTARRLRVHSSPSGPHIERIGTPTRLAFMGSEEDDMPSTLIRSARAPQPGRRPDAPTDKDALAASAAKSADRAA